MDGCFCVVATVTPHEAQAQVGPETLALGHGPPAPNLSVRCGRLVFPIVILPRPAH